MKKTILMLMASAAVIFWGGISFADDDSTSTANSIAQARSIDNIQSSIGTNSDVVSKGDPDSWGEGEVILGGDHPEQDKKIREKLKSQKDKEEERKLTEELDSDMSLAENPPPDQSDPDKWGKDSGKEKVL